MTGDVLHEQVPESMLPLRELDSCLAPVRRLAAWGSAAPAERAAGLRFLEENTQRWVDRALGLDLPAPVVELLVGVRMSVEGYDGADMTGRAERIASLYQAVSRVDALLGLPLRGGRIRPPEKPRLPNWRVEEKPTVADSPEPIELDLDDIVLEVAESRDVVATPVDDDRPLIPREKRSRKAPEVAPPPPPFWDGRMGAPLAGLGLLPELVSALEEAEVETVGDLLFLRPEDTEVLRPVHGAGRALPDDADRLAVGGRVRSRVTLLRPDGSREVRVLAKGADLATFVWSADSRALAAAGGVEAYPPGERIISVGRPVRVGETWELHDPERAFDDGAGGVRLRSYEIDGVEDVEIRGLVGRLLPLVTNVRDLFPTTEQQRVGIEPLRNLLPELHHRDFERARRRLAFDEAFLAQVGLALTRYRQSRDRGLQLTPLHGLITKVATAHGLELSDEKQSAFEDIKRDLRRRTPMRRVLTGAVGSGRGAVAFATILAVAEGKSQVMVVCPDARTAELRYMFAVYPLREGGLVARYVEGEPTTAVRDGISRGEIHVVYGTMELLEANLEFRRLGLVVSEELGNPGAAAAAIQKLRAPKPHLLSVPMGPVTGAQALSVWADHDVTVLPDGPPRPKVQLFPGNERGVVYGRAAETVADGHQVMILFPLVKGEDALDIREGWRLVQALEADAFGTAKIGLFHGKMSRDERLRAYEDFEHRRLDVLVATTPIECAPTPAGVVGLVLEQAERFDAVRLERLRGYLDPARGEGQIWCVHGNDAEEARTRLSVLLDEGDWTSRVEESIDSEDLPSFQWLELDRDGDLVWSAREAAHRLAAVDPRLRTGWATEVARTLKSRWSRMFGDEGPALDLETRTEPGTAPVGRQPAKRRRRRRRKR